MSSARSRDALPVATEVRLHGRRVGVLVYERGGCSFRYEDDLTDPGHQVLGQVFEDEPRKLRRTRTGVPAWFANLLPEGAPPAGRARAGRWKHRRLHVADAAWRGVAGSGHGAQRSRTDR